MNDLFSGPSPVDALRAVLDQLSPKDRAFGESLIASVERARGRASDKQLDWLAELAKRASAPKPERTRTEIGDLAGVMALFDKAREKLKRPVVTLRFDGVGDVRLDVAGTTARVPGSINVSSAGRWGERTWYGRILQDGTFEASPRVHTPEQLADGLKAFACDPAGVASAQGLTTGRCRFCEIELTDERSAAVGYGKTCAANWGLPWGARPSRQPELALTA